MKSALFAILFSTSTLAAAADLSQPLTLVANPGLNQEPYRGAVIVVAPLGNGEHVGFIAAFDAALVDDLIRSQALDAKFVGGLVAWRDGELAAEVEKGAWYVLEPDAAAAMRKPDGLWEELVARAKPKPDGLWEELVARAKPKPDGLWEDLVARANNRKNPI